jgi:N-acetylglucosaminyldiphosphoundecaprenol N-acetyl-beta-D-mannosaminyltransferase
MADVLPAPPRPFRRTRRPEDRVRILGSVVDLIRPEEMLYFVERRMALGLQTIVANHNLHSLYLVRRNAELRAFFQISHLIEVDSIPLLLWARLSGRGSRRFHRCTYLDWRDAFWERANENAWRVFYLGSASGVADEAALRLKARYPRVEIVARDGYFDMSVGSEQSRDVAEQIKAFAPDILFVGMGMPRQENWIMRHHADLGACAIFPVGAAFDYEAGVQKAAPRWLGRLGLEWLFRLLVDPVRLFSRYCIEPWSLILPALRDLVGRFDAKKPVERRVAERRAPRAGDVVPGRRASDYRGRGPRV